MKIIFVYSQTNNFSLAYHTPTYPTDDRLSLTARMDSSALHHLRLVTYPLWRFNPNVSSSDNNQQPVAQIDTFFDASLQHVLLFNASQKKITIIPTKPSLLLASGSPSSSSNAPSSPSHANSSNAFPQLSSSPNAATTRSSNIELHHKQAPFTSYPQHREILLE